VAVDDGAGDSCEATAELGDGSAVGTAALGDARAVGIAGLGVGGAVGIAVFASTGLGAGAATDSRPLRASRTPNVSASAPMTAADATTAGWRHARAP
jgi:hypothetical protein